MPASPSYARAVAVETVAATVASLLALALAARREGRGALQPLNATSHWLNGAAVADEPDAGWRITGVGLLTHAAATAFWAALFEGWRRHGSDRQSAVIGKAVAISGLAALVDYRATPKRFTPGWEFVLRPAGMVAAYAALGGGLALGAFTSGRRSAR